jgi:hypothetical protein
MIVASKLAFVALYNAIEYPPDEKTSLLSIRTWVELNT